MDVSYIDEFTPADCEGRQYSTLDLCDFDKFTLIGNLEVPGVKTCREGREFEVLGEKGQEWLRGVGHGLLVRPDQHILMVLKGDTTVEDVEQCLEQHLRR